MNESLLEAEAASTDTAVTAVGAANALTPGESPKRGGETTGGWLKLAGYGDWPHAAGLPRLTQKAATEMTRSFQSLIGRLRRKFAGVPVYVGHPDDPVFAGQPGHEDTRAYAWLDGLEAREDGLYVKPRWSEPGRDLLRHAFYKFLSPRWQMQAIAPGVFEPVRLLSIGLTNHPNIPGEAVANERETAAKQSENSPVVSSMPTTETKTATQSLRPATKAATWSNEESVRLLPRLLAALEMESGEAEVLIANAENLAQAARETRAAQTEAERFYRLANDADAARQKAEKKFEAERAARTEAVLDLAEAHGQTAPIERARWKEDFAGDFDQTLVALTNARAVKAAPLTSRAPLTARLAGRRLGATGRNEAARLLTLVNERMTRTGEDYATAWSRVKRAAGGGLEAF